MSFSERAYQLKKYTLSSFSEFIRKYFTTEGIYTCILPDRIYLKKLYKKRLGKDLDLKNPKTFNEKLNWLKLYDRRPEYTEMVDKYAAREFVKAKIERFGYKCSDLGLYFIPLLGVWDRVDDIDFDSLPDQFVLKCNHDNGVIICKDKSKLDIEKTKKEVEFHLNRDYYKKGREWPYKNVNRKIVAEKFMSDGAQPSLVDYKFFCFDGKVRALYIVSNRSTNERIDYFDSDFNHLPIIGEYPNSESVIVKPENFEKMIRIASFLSNNIPEVRVDLYNIDGIVYFGEMTFFQDGGFLEVSPDEWNYTFGDWITLPHKKRFR